MSGKNNKGPYQFTEEPPIIDYRHFYMKVAQGPDADKLKRLPHPHEQFIYELSSWTISGVPRFNVDGTPINNAALLGIARTNTANNAATKKTQQRATTECMGSSRTDLAADIEDGGSSRDSQPGGGDNDVVKEEDK
ncbi:hypothetical protein ACHAQA_004266 [Verticillium albo-atrum]